MSKLTWTKPNFSESFIPTSAVSCSTTKNLQISDLFLKPNLTLHVPNCLMGVLLYANKVTSLLIVLLNVSNIEKVHLDDLHVFDTYKVFDMYKVL